MMFNNLLIMRHKTIALLIHAFTASGACFGLFALYAIYQHEWITAFWYMGAAIFIDAIDGMLARFFKVKVFLPKIDGALLDNIVDFFNYTLVPCFFLLVSNLLPDSGRIFCIISIILASSYQFTQTDAKTKDYFFKGFPSYWNIAVFYLFFWQCTPLFNFIILLVLSILSFVPIKYVYPSRLNYLTRHAGLRILMALATIFWGITTLLLLYTYPHSSHILIGLSEAYLVGYALISLYRTFVPLRVLNY